MTFEADLQDAAEAYHALSIPVVPFKLTLKENGEYDKIPLTKWAKWETEPQTDAEFNGLDWANANALAVVLGTKANNGLFLAVIDYDTKGNGLSQDAKTKGLELLKEFPITQTHKTVNKGIHQVYWCRTKPKTDGTFHDSVALELLGEKKLCLMVPSMGYVSMNDNSPTELQDINAEFYGALSKHGFKPCEPTETKDQADLYNLQMEKLVDLSKLNKIGEDEFQGSHPFHDSTTEKNFSVNTRTNEWHCFRHDSGGGALQFLAMKDGVITCEQAKKGALRGGKFRRVLQLAVSQGLLNEKIMSQSEINPIVLAKDVKQEYAFIVDKDSDALFVYDETEGIYTRKTEQLIKREIVARLDENTKSRYYNEVENFIMHSAPIQKLNAKPELVALQNGVLNVLTRELKPSFSPDIYLTRKLRWKYEKDAKCPKIDAFKLKILPEENKRLLAQEYEGYCLFGDLIYKKAYVANGKTDTGKTVHQNILTAFLGEENLCHQTIQALNHNRFSSAELYGKMGNFVDDLPSSIVKSTGFLKMALGHGTIPAERKGKDPFYFRNQAKFWINANDLPPVAKWEDTDAYFNRLLINDYDVQIPVAEQDPNLIYELTTPEEMSGFLNQALDGLDRLMKNKQFTYAKTQDENRIIYTKRSNAAKWFAETYLQVTDDYENYVFHDDLFHTCVKICHQEQLKKIPSSGELIKTIQVCCIGAHYTKIRKTIGYDTKKGKDVVRLVPAWRYVKFVPFVPFVQLFQNPLEDLKIDDDILNRKSDLKKGVQKEQFAQLDESLKQTLETARGWISDNKDRDDGTIDIISLEAFLKESGESDPSKLIEILKRDGVLFTVPKIGKLGAR